MTENNKTFDDLRKYRSRSRICALPTCNDDSAAYFTTSLVEKATWDGKKQKSGKTIVTKQVSLCETHAVAAYDDYVNLIASMGVTL